MSKENKESFGDTFLGVIVAVVISVALFNGEPSLIDSFRVWACNQSGIDAQHCKYEGDSDE